ncbi:transmembrane channel-like protein 7 [Mastacembelus armatus]|uniref:Transmembrane channel-like protein n=1 Tax=Mastacembelus armatus TaxID=205130 RepID=A0A3Q3LR22_9TELE|nr:transmembrane channel-like protein 7 [Mastacembelus armatus]
MEERSANNVNFVRLLSDESTYSDMDPINMDSCEYYQTEIFDQLPSIQVFRPGWNGQGFSDACEADQSAPDMGESSQGQLLKGPKDKASVLPLRKLAMCIQAKREARDGRKLQTRDIGFWESWRQSQSINRRRAWEQVTEALSGLLPWQQTLHTIAGRFGIGVKAYFVFLRYLIYLNLLHCVIVCGFILGPTGFYGRGSNSEPLRFGGNDSILDFFLGKGYLNRSAVFFAFYTRGSLNLPCLNTPLLYFAGILTILFLSLIVVLRRTTVGYKHTWMLGNRYSVNVSYKIFCGWDFTIQDPAAAVLKHSFIRNDLKLFLEEQSFSLREAQRTLGQRVRLYLLRFILNILVLALLSGAFYLIYLAIIRSMVEGEHYWLVSLFIQYLAPITITSVNLVLPYVFCKISSFEDYSFTMQVNSTLVRSIFLKLASLGIYLFFLFKAELTKNDCWENVFGREIYKLCIFNFLATFCNAFLLNYPRKLLQDTYPESLLARLSGKQHFLVPFNVLDLVYIQTVYWVGVYYCPVLPLIGTVILVVTFNIKKFTILKCCEAEQRFFRASSSSVLFHFMLLLGVFMAATTLGFNLYQQDVVMSTCGPFGNGETVFNVTRVCVDSLPSLAQSTLRYLASEAFALPLILAEIIILTSYVSRGQANQKAIERLKDILVISSSDKRFLVKQHATMLRRHKSTRRVRRVATEEGATMRHCKDPAPYTQTDYNTVDSQACLPTTST